MWLCNTDGELTNLSVLERVKVGQDPTTLKWAIKAWCGQTLDIQIYSEEQAAREELARVTEALLKGKTNVFWLCQK